MDKIDEEAIDFAIIMTSGSDTPKHCAAPFVFAATAAIHAPPGHP